MSREALLTFSVGPVHTFIVQARRVADLWTGSEVLSHLVRRALAAGCALDAKPIFPAVDPADLPHDQPRGLPNRFVCRVPENRAEAIARAMDRAVREEWKRLVDQAVEELARRGLGPTDEIYPQAEKVFDIAWSWVAVPEGENGYTRAAREGARRWNAVRHFRPFEQTAQKLEKCAVCGERTALPDGVRENVRAAWQKVEDDAKEAENRDEERFFRFSQCRLCLVCATKRLYTRDAERRAYFSAFDKFQPDDDRTYFALVALDGDKMGDVLTWPEDHVKEDLESFHRELSQALTGFTKSLRRRGARWYLATEGLGLQVQGKSPQLVIAGGEDVMVLCETRDALQVARAIRTLYRKTLEPLRRHLTDRVEGDPFTISAAILFAHTKYPAGLAFREVEDLLKRKAKGEAGRDALALKLVKRGGVPVETAFKWECGEGFVDRLDRLIEKVKSGELTSKQTYGLRIGEAVLEPLFKEGDRWPPWLEDRLRRNGATAEGAREMAGEIAPFFQAGHQEALRFVRFLGREMEKPRPGEEARP